MDDLDQIRKLAGITPANSANMQPYNPSAPVTSNLTGTEKAEVQRDKNIQPGTQDWFRLWFSKPYLTGELPTE